MFSKSKDKWNALVQQAVQNMLRHERADRATDCFGPFYQPKSPDMNKKENTK